MVSTEDGITMDGTESGGFSYTSSDGRTGSCAIDVTYSVVISGEASSSTVTGTICGMSAAEFQTLGT